MVELETKIKNYLSIADSLIEIYQKICYSFTSCNTCPFSEGKNGKECLCRLTTFLYKTIDIEMEKK